MKIETKKKWSERVAEWRASGLSSEEFSEGREFTAGGLRHWAYRLGRAGIDPGAAPLPKVRMARLVRRRQPAAARELARTTDATPRAIEAAAVTLQVGQVKIAVSTGFDRGTLATVLDVLGVEGTR